MNFFTSDTHFNHVAILEYCQRPFASVEEMNEAMIKNWNEVVEPKDTVFHLGDVGLGQRHLLPSITARLNGFKILIKGNHDTKGLSGFNQVLDDAKLLGDDLTVYMRHVPDFSKFGQDVIHLHGHVHTDFKRQRNLINAGVDQWGFRPQTLAQLLTARDQYDDPEIKDAREAREAVWRLLAEGKSESEIRALWASGVGRGLDVTIRDFHLSQGRKYHLTKKG